MQANLEMRKSIVKSKLEHFSAQNKQVYINVRQNYGVVLMLLAFHKH